MEYIDLHQALKEIDEWQDTFEKHRHRETVSDLYLVRDTITDLKPITIIRCKECGYADKIYQSGVPKLMCTFHTGQSYAVDTTDFCSQAIKQ